MASSPIIQLTFPEPDIARLTLDDPSKGANVLSTGVLAELSAHLDALSLRTDIAGLVIASGKPGSFVVGADIREFAASIDAPADQTIAMATHGRKLFQRLSQMPFVTVAAIDGLCLGGGAELAIWCDRRVMSADAKAQFGFPEVKLGLFPGWGGTARASRIVGLGNAVELVTTGDAIDGRAALSMGLVSDVNTAAALPEAAIRLIRAERKTDEYLRDRQRWSGPIAINGTELGFLGATASGYIQQQTKGRYPAPLAALEVMLGAAEMDIEAACQAEAEAFAQLFGSPVNRALIHVFFLSDRNKKDTGVAKRDVAARPIKSVSVVGAGIMGQGIAAANLKRRVTTVLSDAAPDALAKGVSSVLEEVAYNKATKSADAAKALQLATLLHATAADAEIATSDLVIEAIVENPTIKAQLYARLEPQMRPDAILASNTSTIPITKLAAGLKWPEQFCGIHFFNPVRKMPIVEIIRGEKTSDETIATAVAYAKSIGKSTVVVNDGPGFLVNRLLFPYMNEAVQLLIEGGDMQAIDRAAKEFGMPMGPIALYDMVGLDTSFYAGRVMWEAFPDRVLASNVLPVLMKAGRLGQKSGAGFFAYDPKDKSGRGKPDPAVDQLLSHILAPKKKFSKEELTNRLILPMLLEATRVLQEKVVRSVRDVDLGLIYAIGFPPFQGGLLYWGDTLGAKTILEMLKPLESLGPRFQPTPLLLEMAANNKKFYDMD